MKKVIAWAKAHLAIVILSAAMIIALPAAFIGSSLWNSSIRTKRQAEAAKVMQDLDAARVTYALPPSAPGVQPVSLALSAPNRVATEYFKAQKQRIEEQSAAFVQAAEQLNSRGRTPLVEGVFPNGDQLKTIEFAEALVGKGGAPSAYQRLLQRINAGGPSDPAPIVDAVKEQEALAVERARAEGRQGGAPAPEEIAALRARLVDIRLGQYRQHARNISVYATDANLPPSLPRAVPTEPPSAATAYLWQMDYWFLSDLLDAVAKANTEGGRLTPVDQSVVKSIESIAIEPLRSTTAPTHTGRVSKPDNADYDVRHADLTLVVASDRLPQLLSAISSTNFMSVVGLSISAVDARADLERGLYYGPDHVARVALRVESVWLRSWTTPITPPAVVAMLTNAEGGGELGGGGGGAGGGGNAAENFTPQPRGGKGGRGGRGGD